MPTKTRIYFTGVAVILAAVYSGFEFRNARQFERITRAEQTMIVELRDALSKPQPQASERSLADPTPRSPAAGTAPLRSPDHGLEAKRLLGRETRLAWGRRLLAEHPELRQLAIEINAAQFFRMNRDFFRTRGFPDQQITALARRLAEETGMETFWSDYGNFFLRLTNRPESEANRRQDAILHEALGEAGFDDFERFADQSMAHARVQHLAALLVASDQPLTKSAAEQLELIFNRAASPSSPLKPANWPTVLSEAQPLLSPAQMDALRLLQREETVGLVK